MLEDDGSPPKGPEMSEDVRSEGPKMLEDGGSPPQGTHPLISTRASGSSPVLMLDVEDGGCDARPGGLGGGAPLSTTRIYKLVQFQT